MNSRPPVYDRVLLSLVRAQNWLDRIIQNRFTDADDTGVYVVAMDITDAEHPFVFGALLVGFVADSNKRDKYIALALEKCTRLALHPRHISSAQSADESLGHYAGAARGDIVIDGRIIAVGTSGFVALADEAMSAMILQNAGLCNNTHLTAIAMASNNQILPQLF